MSEAFKANQGEIIEKPIYIDGELAYTVKSCKAEPDKDGNVYIAVLVIPEAGQKFNIDGEFGNGTNYNEKTSNLIVDRVVHDGKKYYSNEDLVAKCEKLLGIEADDLDDNCALFYPLMWKAEKSEIDKILNDPFLFEIDTITARIEGGVKTINPNDCKAK